MTGEFVLKRCVGKPCTVLLTTPFLPISKGLSDERIAAHMSHLLPEIAPLVRYGSAKSNVQVPKSDHSSGNEKDLILNAMAEAYSKQDWLGLAVPKLLAAVRMKRAAFDAALNNLKKQEIVKADELKMSAKGAATRFLEFTEQGIAMMTSKALTLAIPGVVHRAVVQAVEQFYTTQKVPVSKEKVIASQRCDLFVNARKANEIVEVALSNPPEDLLAKAIEYFHNEEVTRNRTVLTFVCADSAKTEDLKKFIAQACQKQAVSLSVDRIQFRPAYWYFQNRQSKQGIQRSLL